MSVKPGEGQSEILVLHEDDWRQCEFVACSQHLEISAELADIRLIHMEAAGAYGWRQLHVRERIAHPLPLRLEWQKVARLIGPFEPLTGVAFSQKEGVVANTVGARLPEDVAIWGIVTNGDLSVLCVENLDSASDSKKTTLKRVADSLSLALIHWCSCQVYCQDNSILNSNGALWS